VPVKIFVNNTWSRMSGLAREANVGLVDELDRQMSYPVEGHQYMKAFRQGWYDKESGQWRHWDGRRHLLTPKMVFPTGLLARAKDLLGRWGVEHELVDERTDPVGGGRIAVSGKPPWPHQEAALKAALKEGRGIIRIATGGGKTKVAAMIAAEYNIPTMVYVVGKDLLHQFHREMCRALGDTDVGIVGDGHCDVRKFTVCSVWTAATAFGLKTGVSVDDEDWEPEIVSMGPHSKRAIQAAVENAGLAVFDEAHFLACDTIQAIFKASRRCRYMFGMTGTDWRDDGADLLLEAACGKRIFNMPASKLIEQGYLVVPKIALVEVPPLEAPCPANWGAVYDRYVTSNQVRNQMVVEGAQKLVGMGRKVLILVRYLSHGEKLVDMLGSMPVFFVNGGMDGETRQGIKERFEAGELRCLVASSVFDIGVDIPSLDALIPAGGGKSTVRILQRIGRVIRACEGKKDALVMDFIDNARYLDKHSAIRIATYEAEPGFKVKFPPGFDRGLLRKTRKTKAKN
jgi:superfamily II DNA or RNA helicase